MAALSHRLVAGASLVGRFLLLVVSVIALLSFGGQLILAPVLIPLQWLAARAADRNGRIVFTFLASLLMFEVGWMLGYLATSNPALSVVGAVAAGGATAILVYRTAADRRWTRAVAGT